VNVQFDADASGIRVLALGGSVPVSRVVGYRYGWWVSSGYAPVYSPVCRAPCTARLVPGDYQLALAKEGGGAVPVSGTVPIAGPSAIHAEYEDHSGLRVAGWVIGVVGTVGGAIMIGSSVRGREFECDSRGFCRQIQRYDGGLLAGGIAVAVASLVAGSILVTRHDGARLSVEPLPGAVREAPREAPIAAFEAGAPLEGAAVALHF